MHYIHELRELYSLCDTGATLPCGPTASMPLKLLRPDAITALSIEVSYLGLQIYGEIYRATLHVLHAYPHVQRTLFYVDMLYVRLVLPRMDFQASMNPGRSA